LALLVALPRQSQQRRQPANKRRDLRGLHHPSLVEYPGQGFGQRAERNLAPGHRSTAENCQAKRSRSCRELRHQPGLADPRLPGDDHDRATAPSGVTGTLDQEPQLSVATDERA
jgi:hypothetical protein